MSATRSPCVGRDARGRSGEAEGTAAPVARSFADDSGLHTPAIRVIAAQHNQSPER